MSNPLIRALTLRIGFALLVSHSASASTDPHEACMSAALQNAVNAGAHDTTVGELLQQCPPVTMPAEETVRAQIDDSDPAPLIEEGASFKDAIAAEQQSLDRSYSLTPHWPNYLLAYSRNTFPNRDEAVALGDSSVDKQETVLQVSVKFPLWREIIGKNNDLLFAYTSKSWFQAYNRALSKPFRETNYEPEIFWRHYGGPKLLGMEVATWDFGYLHQSNGRSEPLSRSWDRLNGRMSVVLHPNLSLLLRAWYRIPESASVDDNPDLYQYVGYGDLRAIWAPNRNTFTALYRPASRKSAVELSWSYPINNHVRVYAQYYRGFGESLIDYDHEVERFGIGLTINDFLQAPW